MSQFNCFYVLRLSCDHRSSKTERCHCRTEFKAPNRVQAIAKARLEGWQVSQVERGTDYCPAHRGRRHWKSGQVIYSGSG